MFQSSARHRLAQATFFDKIFLEPAQLLIEQVGRDLDEANDGVSADFGFGMFDCLLDKRLGWSRRLRLL